MLVIADETKPMALAGIMGGDESGVEPEPAIYFWRALFSVPMLSPASHFAWLQFGLGVSF